MQHSSRLGKAPTAEGCFRWMGWHADAAKNQTERRRQKKETIVEACISHSHTVHTYLLTWVPNWYVRYMHMYYACKRAGAPRMQLNFKSSARRPETPGAPWMAFNVLVSSCPRYPSLGTIPGLHPSIPYVHDLRYTHIDTHCRWPLQSGRLICVI